MAIPLNHLEEGHNLPMPGGCGGKQMNSNLILSALSLSTSGQGKHDHFKGHCLQSAVGAALDCSITAAAIEPAKVCVRVCVCARACVCVCAYVCACVCIRMCVRVRHTYLVGGCRVVRCLHPPPQWGMT